MVSRDHRGDRNSHAGRVPVGRADTLVRRNELRAALPRRSHVGQGVKIVVANPPSTTNLIRFRHDVPAVWIVKSRLAPRHGIAEPGTVSGGTRPWSVRGGPNVLRGMSRPEFARRGQITVRKYGVGVTRREMRSAQPPGNCSRFAVRGSPTRSPSMSESHAHGRYITECCFFVHQRLRSYSTRSR